MPEIIIIFFGNPSIQAALICTALTVLLVKFGIRRDRKNVVQVNNDIPVEMYLNTQEKYDLFISLGGSKEWAEKYTTDNVLCSYAFLGRDSIMDSKTGRVHLLCAFGKETEARLTAEAEKMFGPDIKNKNPGILLECIYQSVIEQSQYDKSALYKYIKYTFDVQMRSRSLRIDITDTIYGNTNSTFWVDNRIDSKDQVECAFRKELTKVVRWHINQATSNYKHDRPGTEAFSDLEDNRMAHSIKQHEQLYPNYTNRYA